MIPCQRKRHADKEQQDIGDGESGTKHPSIEPKLKRGDSNCDFLIMCDSKTHHVHKSVLCAGSRYFSALLEGITCMKEAQNSRVELREISSEALDTALRFMYQTEVNLSLESIEAVLDVASRFQMDAFLDICCDFLMSHFEFCFFSFCVELASRYSLARVIHHIESTIAEKFPSFAESLQFYEIDALMFSRIAGMDSLNVRSEKWLLTEIERWSEWRSQNESDSLLVLSRVRFCLMPCDELTLLLHRKKVFPPEIQQLIRKAISYHDDFIKGHPIVCSEQNRIRSSEASLVLVVEESLNHSYELIACRMVPGTSGPLYSLYTDAAHHRTCGTVFLDNFLFIVSLEFDAGFDVDASVMLNCFDPRRLQQRLLPPPRHQVVCSAIAICGRKIYLCGGVSRSSTVFVSLCEAFDVDSLVWEDVRSLPSPLHQSAASAVADSLYVSGGLDQSRMTTNQLLRLKPGGDTGWEVLAPMRCSRRSHSMVAESSGKLLVCGGLRDTGLRSGTPNEIPIERYDTATDQWTVLSRATMLPGTSLGHYAILPKHEKRLYILGHELHSAQENEIWKIDLDECSETFMESCVALTLPPRISLNNTVSSYLYINYNDHQLQGIGAYGIKGSTVS